MQEKDVFEKYYKQHLAKRLLHGRSSSEDAGAGMGSGDVFYFLRMQGAWQLGRVSMLVRSSVHWRH